MDSANHNELCFLFWKKNPKLMHICIQNQQHHQTHHEKVIAQNTMHDELYFFVCRKVSQTDFLF